MKGVSAGVSAVDKTSIWAKVAPAVENVASGVVDSTTTYFYEKTHRTKSKNIIKYISLIPKSEFRKLILQAASDIFLSFEAQFSVVLDLNGTWMRAMEKLAIQLTDCSLNYIDKLGRYNESVDIGPDFIVKSMLRGKPKQGYAAMASSSIGLSKLEESNILSDEIKAEIPKAGHTLKYHDRECKITEIIKGVGVVKMDADGQSRTYFRRKYFDKANIFGYRLMFSWETAASFRGDTKPSKEYKHILSKEVANEKFDKLLTEINSNDNELSCQNVHQTMLSVNEIKNEVQNISNTCDNTSRDVLEVKEKVDMNLSISAEISNDMKRIAGLVENSCISVPFNVMPPVLTFTGRKRDLEKIHKNLEADGTTMVSQMVVQSGLGGIGKSELVRKYISEYYEYYNNRIIWIDAETYQSLSGSFRNLGVDVLFNNEDDIDLVKSLPVKEIADKVYKKLSSQKSLFIFDNAQRLKSASGDEGIEELLPKASQFLNKIFVIITSRFQEWSDITVLNLDVFTKEESELFVRTVLKINNDEQNQLIAIFTDTLQHFPLALQQAASYIKETNAVYENSNRKFGISEYLSKYHTETKALLDYNFFDKTWDNYQKTVYTTWKITVDKIKQDEPYGMQAVEVLDKISFLGSNNILIELFIKGVQNEDDINAFGNGLRVLKQYSMVSSESTQDRFKVHRLVQEVTRIDLESTNRTSSIFVKLYNLFDTMMNFNRDDMDYDSPDVSEIILTHLETYLKHLENKLEDGEMRNKYVYNVLLWMIEIMMICSYEFTDDKYKIIFDAISKVLNMDLYNQEDLLVVNYFPENVYFVSATAEARDFVDHLNKFQESQVLRSCHFTDDVREKIISDINSGQFEKTECETYVPVLMVQRRDLRFEIPLRISEICVKGQNSLSES